MSKTWLILLVLLTLLATSCKKDKIGYNFGPQKSYLHLSHTREVDNPNIISGVAAMTLDTFDLLLLGGDLGASTSDNIASMSFYDQIFNFGSPQTLWTLGNHDYGNINNVTAFTNRPRYYAHHENGITFIVLDTQLDSTNITGSQLLFLNSVLDTMQTSSHCIVLHHKLLWLPNSPVFAEESNQISNGDIGTCHWCLNASNNFYSDVYPNLVAVQERGIEVLLVGGDFGNKVSSFDYKTEEGIHFLGSGLTYSSGGSGEYLVFSHYPKIQRLDWRFERYLP